MNVDASIESCCLTFSASGITAGVGLNSFQTSGVSPGDLQRCHIGILGLGTVGLAVARRLAGPDSILSLIHI